MITPKSTRRRPALLAVALLIGSVLTVYWPVLGFDFINLDDDLYVTANPRVRAGLTPANVLWAFSSTRAPLWHPLTWLSHMADCQLYGLAPAGHHVTNLVLHVANAVLVFLVFRRMTGAVWRSAVVAGLFALHPLRVESVAWVAERKDVLSAFFCLLALWSYAAYVERPGARRFGLVALCLVLGLLAKPMLVTLPFLLLLLDYWPLGRLGRARVILEKLPLVAAAAVVSVVTIEVARRREVLASLETVALEARLANGAVSYARYVAKTLWPVRLAVFYPPESWLAWQVAGAALLLGGISAVAIAAARRRPYLPVGWFWFVGTLVPVIGLVQAGVQAMGDRFTYLPQIGLFVVVAWGVHDILLDGPGRARVLAGCGVLTLLMLAAASRQQLGYWQNSSTLFTHALAVTTGNWLAHINLGAALVEQGRTEEAMAHFAAALRLKPGLPEAESNLASLLVRQGKTSEAIPHFAAALRAKPDYAVAHYNLALVLEDLRQTAAAVSHYQRAVTLDPQFADAHFNLARLLDRLGRRSHAMRHLLTYRKLTETRS